MKKIFLTGASGFLGSYLLRALVRRGYQVRALKRKSSPLHLVQDILNQVEWVDGDINDFASLEEALEGIEDVYHAAALVSFDSKDKAEMLKVNFQGTENIVNIAQEKGIRKFLYVSSIAALGRKENVKVINEEAQWENNKYNTDYAISKFKGECEVWRAIQEGLSAVIVNPSMIMGAGYWHAGTAKMFKQIDKGLMFYPQGGTGFVDVRDVAEASIKLMESDVVGERFILNAENLFFKDVFDQIAQVLQKKPPFLKAGKGLIDLMWRLDSIKSTLLGISPVLTKELARNMQLYFEYDNSKIKKELNFQFIPIRQTIAETGLSYLDAKKNKVPFNFFS
jgi:dihydroflavonol-4-reductase